MLCSQKYNTHTYQYDANGNLTYIATGRKIKDGHTEDLISEHKLLWDDENRLVAISDNGYVSTYRYDDAGNRTVKLSGTYYKEDPTYKPKIIGTGGYSYETTVENIASSVIVHEWYSHGKKYNSDEYKSHRLAYKNVINFKRLWDKTTDEYKKFNLQQLLKYTKKETGRNNVDPRYRRLYNKYVK